MIGRVELVRQLRSLGVAEGDILLVHTSFRTVGPVEGGPLGLISALRGALGPAGTLVMPSWSGEDDEPFDPLNSPSASDLGVTAQMFWRQPGVLRSDHFHAFAAAGPAAEAILADPLPLPPHGPLSPVGRVHERDGKILLLGVGHDGNTTLHLAELMADVPYRTPGYCTVLHDGRKQRIDYGENNHCCRRFALADGWLRDAGLQDEGPVGQAPSRLMRAHDLVRLALAQLARDRLLFLHGPEDHCHECDEARASISEISRPAD
ncbi:AAC(3)-IV family aminoglycoside N-acetyltransferase [Taklimakanibacter lacteus]|uniref:AAC(3)-IV family aminoglycoside N-acetyltransferase n=1 Tax=Taklimakanibacter lacteus TaxID=2268456 RepID=UPI000E65F505